MANRLSYEPPLPGTLVEAFSAWGSGSVIKLNVRYEAPFWRREDRSGSVLWADPQGLYACDASRADYSGLVMFVGGPLALEWHGRPHAELRASSPSASSQPLARKPPISAASPFATGPTMPGATAPIATSLSNRARSTPKTCCARVSALSGLRHRNCRSPIPLCRGRHLGRQVGGPHRGHRTGRNGRLRANRKGFRPRRTHRENPLDAWWVIHVVDRHDEVICDH